MRTLLLLLKMLFGIIVGLAIMFVAFSIPVYFTSVDENVVISANKARPSISSFAQMYIDSAKPSVANMLIGDIDDNAIMQKQIAQSYDINPTWYISGGDETFFDTVYTTIPVKPQIDKKSLSGIKFYTILALGENRKKLEAFLKHSKLALVQKVLDLKSLNTTLLPAVHTSAGAPLEASILTVALLIQSSELNAELTKSIYTNIENAKSKQDSIEKFLLATMILAKDLDWTQLRVVSNQFNSIEDLYDYVKLYKGLGENGKLLLNSSIISGNQAECVKFLSSLSAEAIQDLSRAYKSGEGSLKFLIKNQKPIYKESYISKHLHEYTSPIKKYLAEIAVENQTMLLFAKIILSIIGSYIFIRSFLNIFFKRADTPSWKSPLALTRGVLEALVVASLLFLLAEPKAFMIKIANDNPIPELKFNLEKITKNVGVDNIMQFQTDTATLSAIVLFVILQFIVYVLCLIRLSNIKRQSLSPKLKLKLLENEDNLFDLGLYIGLSGTVVSLILLTMNVVTASLMAAYASTLFGILVTAMIKVVHVRRYKAKLLVESERLK